MALKDSPVREHGAEQQREPAFYGSNDDPAPVDTWTILRARPGAKLTKTWGQDVGERPKPQSTPLYVTPSERSVASLADLSKLLSELEGDPRACLIRGRIKPDWRDLQAERLPTWQEGRKKRKKDTLEPKPGECLRRGELFEDVPHQAMMIDIDNFPLLEGESYAEAIERCLVFHPELSDRSYHWQLSGSCGHPTSAGKLKCHLWFWLDRPLTSAELKRWAEGQSHFDAALYSTVQIHYTAGPEFAKGATQPGFPRSGFVQGAVDEVSLTIPAPRGNTSQAKRAGDLLDPREKGGVIGAFHRAFTVEEVLEKHIPGQFEWGTDTRLTWLRSEGGAEEGAYVREDRQGIGASHNSWPGGPDKMHNLFDLVRVFRFRHLDEPTGDDLLDLVNEDPTKSGSYRACLEWAKALPEVQMALGTDADGRPLAQFLTTDQANADRIIRQFHSEIMVSGGSAFTWCGTHWKPDDGQGLHRYALRLSQIIMAESNEWASRQASTVEEGENNTKIAASLKAWAKKSEDRKAIEAAISLVKRQIVVEHDRLDADPWALNCLNGTVDLRTGQVRPHNPEDYITRLIPLSYCPAALAPHWEQTVAEITLEDTQAERPIAGFLQRWFGYCATGSTREQCFAVHWGSGANGKSTLIGTIETILSGYADTAPPALLKSTRFDGHPAEIAVLAGKRLVTSHETEEGFVLKDGFIKQATGSDKLTGRFMRQDWFSFTPTHKLQLLTNNKPTIRSQDHGIWRRVLLVPFLAKFGQTPGECDPGDTTPATHCRDRDLAARLEAEKEGILRWIVAGAVEWFEKGLNPPDLVSQASRDYQAEQDRVGHFVNECCELDRSARCPLGDLYRDYEQWAKESGFHPVSKPRFEDRLDHLIPGYRKAKGKASSSAGGRRRDVVWVYGVSLLPVELHPEHFDPI